VVAAENRLFSVACCNCVWQHLEEPSRRAVRVIERFAEGRANEQERALAEVEATEVSTRLASAFSDSPHDTPIPPEACAAAAVLNLTASTEVEATWLPFDQFIAEQVAGHVLLAECVALGEAVVERIVRLGGEDPSRRALSDRLRDVIGNPFRPITLETCWRKPEVVSLAQVIEDEQAFERMGMLADSLEDVGCTNADIVGHCRGPGPHVRGCWLLDLILGKE
jgi:hypothetical protein